MDITIILLIVNVFAAVTVIGLTLIQQPKGDMGSAFGGGGSQSMFGSRGSANFLTKSTSWMCFVFFASSLMLAYMYAQQNNNDGVVDQSVIKEISDLPSIIDTPTAIETPASDLPSIPVDDAAQALESGAESAAEAAADTVSEGADAAQGLVDQAAEALESATEEPVN